MVADSQYLAGKQRRLSTWVIIILDRPGIRLRLFCNVNHLSKFVVFCYHLSRTNGVWLYILNVINHRKFDDKRHIIYVNGGARCHDTELGRLMEDFFAKILAILTIRK